MKSHVISLDYKFIFLFKNKWLKTNVLNSFIIVLILILYSIETPCFENVMKHYVLYSTLFVISTHHTSLKVLIYNFEKNACCMPLCMVNALIRFRRNLWITFLSIILGYCQFCPGCCFMCLLGNKSSESSFHFIFSRTEIRRLGFICSQNTHGNPRSVGRDPILLNPHILRFISWRAHNKNCWFVVIYLSELMVVGRTFSWITWTNDHYHVLRDPLKNSVGFLALEYLIFCLFAVALR